MIGWRTRVLLTVMAASLLNMGLLMAMILDLEKVLALDTNEAWLFLVFWAAFALPITGLGLLLTVVLSRVVGGRLLPNFWQGLLFVGIGSALGCVPFSMGSDVVFGAACGALSATIFLFVCYDRIFVEKVRRDPNRE